MSFSTDIKKEITTSEDKDCCKKAQLTALLQMYGHIKISNRQQILIFKSENILATKTLKILFKDVLNLKTTQKMLRKSTLKKNLIFENEVEGNYLEIYEALGLYSKTRGFLEYPSYNIVQKDCCAKSYLSGIFLAYGSCNRPESTAYHLEMSVESLALAQFVVKLLNRFNLDGKIIKRRSRYVVYLKKSDQISDFLKMIKAPQSMLLFEEVRMERDLLHSCIRINNCDIANAVKSLEKANLQTMEAKAIKEKISDDELNDKLLKVIDLRIKYPEHSLKELVEAYSLEYHEAISKSGLRHRFDKISEIFRSIKNV